MHDRQGPTSGGGRFLTSRAGAPIYCAGRKSDELGRLKPVDAIIEPHREIRGIERGRLFRKYFLLILGLVCGALLI